MIAAGNAVDNDRAHPPLAVQALEGPDFFIDPSGLRARGRTDDQHEQRVLEGCLNLRTKIVRGGEFVAVAKDRGEPAGDRTVFSVPPDDFFWCAITFELAVKPFAPLLVPMAVADESPVFPDVPKACSPAFRSS